MTRSTIIASIAVAAILVLGIALSLAPLFTTVGPGESPVAMAKQTYSDVSKARHVAGEIATAMTDNGFVLNRPPVTIESIALRYFRAADGLEISIEGYGNRLEVYIYDMHRKGMWREIKDKIEAAMTHVQ